MERLKFKSYWPLVRIASQVDLGARTISPSKCLRKIARAKKETEMAGIAHVKGANI